MSRTTPVRTCIGCRERAAASDLLRLALDETATSVVPDAAGRQPGRGAHLHARPACFELAQRRRAFPRAFRVEGPLDTSAVRAWLETPPGRPFAAGADTRRKAEHALMTSR